MNRCAGCGGLISGTRSLIPDADGVYQMYCEPCGVSITGPPPTPKEPAREVRLCRHDLLCMMAAIAQIGNAMDGREATRNAIAIEDEVKMLLCEEEG